VLFYVTNDNVELSSKRELRYSSPVFFWRDAHNSSEPFGKIIWIIKSHTESNIFYRAGSEVSIADRLLHFHLYKIIDRRIACLLFKKIGEPGYRIIILAAEIPNEILSFICSCINKMHCPRNLFYH
jgi:hypothetical protein